MSYIQRAIEGMTNPGFLTAVAALFGLFFLRYLLIRGVNSLNFKHTTTKYKILYATKNISLLIILVVFIFMWGEELRSLALSLAAVAVAFVIAMKEVILNATGGILKASSNLFEIGDRINIKGIRGEVIDHNLLLTTLLEIGPGESSNQYTGKLIKIPNSLFLTESFYTTPSGNPYSLNVLAIPADLDKHIFRRQEILLKAAQQVSAPYAQLAEEYITAMCKKQNVKVPDLNPRVLYEVTGSSTVEFHIRMPMPFNGMTRTENKVKDMYLAEVFKEIN